MSSRRVAAVALGVVSVAALLVLGGRAGWSAWADRARDGVAVTTTYACPGAGLATFQQRQAIRSRPGWRCTAEVLVTNGGPRDVRVTGIVGPGVGSRMGAEAVAVAGGLGEPTGEVDAAWTVDETVPAGGKRTFDLALAWREDGCNSAGHFWVPGWPEVEVRSLGRTVVVPSADRLTLRTYDDPHDERACPD